MNIEKNRVKERLERKQKKVSSSITTLLPANGWMILAQFVMYKRTFSINELYKIVYKAMHINTVRAMVFKLELLQLISMNYFKSGKTLSEKRYLITHSGRVYWNIKNDITL